MNYTFATLLSSSDYLLGVIVLYKSLQKYGKTQYPFLCVCSKSIKDDDISKLQKLGIKCKKLAISATEDIDLSEQPPEYQHWNNTFDKLLLWGLTEYDKIVFLDSDMMVMDNIDDLFEKPRLTGVALGQQLFNRNQLNAGLIVIEPNEEICKQIISLIPETVNKYITERGFVGDEEVINNYIPDWMDKPELHLHEGYNMVFRNMTAYHQLFNYNYGENIKVIHFIGRHDKPWKHHLWEVFYHIVGYFLHNRYGLRAYVKYQMILYATSLYQHKKNS